LATQSRIPSFIASFSVCAPLTLDVLGTHVDHARQAEPRADRGGGDAVLTRAGLGDDPRLAHPHREQDLADAVVDLVRAGVVQFVALEPDLRAHAFGGGLAQSLGQPFGVVERARAADIMFEQIVELRLERRVGLGGAIRLVEFKDERHKRLGDIAATEVAEMAALVGLRAVGVGGEGWSVHAERFSTSARCAKPLYPREVCPREGGGPVWAPAFTGEQLRRRWP
jgi:hypothetical protein